MIRGRKEREDKGKERGKKGKAGKGRNKRRRKGCALGKEGEEGKEEAK